MQSTSLALCLRTFCVRIMLVLPPVFAFQGLPALSQVTYQGSGSWANFGTAGVGQNGSKQTLNFQVAAGTSVGNISVLTQGQPGFDFNQVDGFCTPPSNSSASTCSVTVAFKPLAAGPRLGAVVFYGTSSGAPIATLPISGIGESGLVAFLPPSMTNVAGFEGSEVGLASAVEDPAGNLFVLNRVGTGAQGVPSGRVVEFFPNSGTSLVIYVDQNSAAPPTSLAMDGAGNLYIACYNYVGFADTADAVVQKWTRQENGYYGYTGNVGSVTNPSGVATDGEGNVFILDTGHSIYGVASASGARVVKVSPAGVQSTVLSLAPYALNNYWLPASNIAVDRAGTLYLIDGKFNIRAFSPNGSGAYTSMLALPIVGAVNPFSLALDGGGNFYVEDAVAGTTVQMTEVTRTGQQTVIAKYTNAASGAGPLVDQAGNLFIQTAQTQFGNRNLTKITRSTPSPISFANPTKGGSVDITDGPVTTTIQNVGNSGLLIEAVGIPKDFPEVSGSSNPCVGSLTLFGNNCILELEFAPKAVSNSNVSIPLAESLVVATNSSNGLGSSNFAIPVTGTEGKLVPSFTLVTQSPTAKAGAQVRIVASLTGTGTIPTGTVRFTYGNKIAVLPLTKGITVLDLSNLPVGTTNIVGTYSGDAVYATVTSASLTETITQ